MKIIILLVIFVFSIPENNKAKIKVEKKNNAETIKDSTKVVVPDSQRSVLMAKPFGGKGKGSNSGSKATDTYRGSGVSYSIPNRVPQALPAPEYKREIEGIVVVEVTVNKDGKVIQAIPGVKGTTTLDESLWEAAKKAAQMARFDRKPDASEYQKGIITYRFRLQ